MYKKGVMHLQSYFANLDLLVYYHSRCVAVVFAKVPFC